MNKYASIILNLMPRMLSSIDTDTNSKTYGCMHKAYWLYKTSDFACSRLQEPCLVFALLYKNKFEGNVYYNNKKIKELAIASMFYLTEIQHKDGSFDEWYPNEKSFVATAFVIYNATETFKLLKDEIPSEIKEQLLKTFEKAGRWLCRHNELSRCNQQAGAIASLYNIYSLTKNKKFKQEAEKKLVMLEKKQSKEGWFFEYEGADIGYSTLMLDFLASYYNSSKNKKVLKPVAKLLDFLAYFVHPDGSMGGIYGSRNTEFKMVYGFHAFSKINFSSKDKAAYIAEQVYNNIENTLNPGMMDDQYAFLHVLSYLKALLENLSFKYKKPELEQTKLFDHAGLLIIRKKYFLIVSLKKGGVFKLYSNGKLKESNSGLLAISKKEIYSTQWFNSSYAFEKNKIIIDGSSVKLMQKSTITPKKNIALRSFLATFGRSSLISSAFQKIVRHKVLSGAKKTSMRYQRIIEFLPNEILVTDKIKNIGKNVKTIRSTSNFNPFYVPTAFFSQHFVEEDKRNYYDGKDRVEIKKIIRLL